MPMDVLVIDDEIISRMMISQTLRSAGYRVTECDNGEEGLRRIRDEHFQLVVCDWNMPGMNGLELCRAVRSHLVRHYVYILMVTSHAGSQDTLEGLSAGADDYVVKPFNPAELTLRVNTGRRIIRAESRDITIFALAKLAESRDPETGAHLERVRNYCRVLAESLKNHTDIDEPITDDFVRLIYETSPLHDIGKVAIPDAILLKPGRLTSGEFKIMQTHTLHGAETLAAALEHFPNASFLRMARNIALHHHEKFDGTGYPHGLAGEDIPLCGRIVALADVYDALTSKRVYKGAMRHNEAKAIIVADSGTHFDPRIIDAFQFVEDEFLQISRRYAEDEFSPHFGTSEAMGVIREALPCQV